MFDWFFYLHPISDKTIENRLDQFFWQLTWTAARFMDGQNLQIFTIFENPSIETEKSANNYKSQPTQLRFF